MGGKVNSEQQRAYRATWSDEYKAARKLRMRAYLRERNTGWTLERYDAYVREHGHVCAVCAVDLLVGESKMQPTSECCDHDHATRRPRGLLCQTCNVCIGHYERQLRTRIKIDVFEKYLNAPTS